VSGANEIRATTPAACGEAIDVPDAPGPAFDDEHGQHEHLI
jgi:hypothetical protein